MPEYQIDTEKQTFWVGHGRNYAWTNVYLIDADDDDAAQAWMIAIAEREALVMPSWASVRFVQWRRGIGGPRPADPLLLGLSGALPSGTTPNLQLLMTARLVGQAGGRLVWYKRWRGPLRLEDVNGPLLAEAYLALLQGTLLDWLVEDAPILTRSGRAIDNAYVDPRVWPWQMRDGGRRRSNSVLAS